MWFFQRYIETKIYPSSYSPASGFTVNAKFPNGCLRHQKFQYFLPRGGIHPTYKLIGDFGEVEVEKILKKRHKTLIREKSFRFWANNTLISGRMDFLVLNELIYEVKTTLSKFCFTKWINKGIPEDSHIGQLVTYLVIHGYTEGRLITQYAHFPKSDLLGPYHLSELQLEQREFVVKVIGNHVYIDSKPYSMSVFQILRYYGLTKFYRKVLPPRTINADACKRCPFQKICDSDPKDISQFVDIANHELAGTAVSDQKVPSINCHNVRKRRTL